MKKKTDSTVHHLPSSLKRLGRSIGRRNRKSIARQCMKDTKIRAHVMNITASTIKKEIKTLSTLKCSSLLRNTTAKQLNSFRWEDLIKEMKLNTPTLLEVIQGCVTKKQRGNSGKRSYRVKDEVIIGICTAILIRHQNTQMNFVQRMLS